MNRTFYLAAFLFFASNAVAFQSSSSVVNNKPILACRPNAAVARTKNNNERPLKAHSSSIYYRNDAASAEEVLAVADSTATVQQPQHQRQEETTEQTSGVSMPLIRAIWFNQATILLSATTVLAGISMLFGNGVVDFNTLHWASGHFYSLFDWTLTPFRVLEGVMATIPLIALGNLVEHSDNRDASHVNFATTNMVISLFGRRKSIHDPTGTSNPALVMMLSLAIALSTGLSEELVFRGYAPVALTWLFHNPIPLALIGQALLFALAHISPTSSKGENKVVGGLQFMNGIWYGLVYQMTGGDILPCIIAHMLYDMHVLCETWNVVNKQMDYTKTAFHNKLPEAEEVAIQKLQEQAGPSLNRETLDFAKRFFYAFDSQHKGSLSLCDVQRAVSYAFLKDKVIPAPERVEETFHQVLKNRTQFTMMPTDRLVISEFLQVLFDLKSNKSSVVC